MLILSLTRIPLDLPGRLVRELQVLGVPVDHDPGAGVRHRVEGFSVRRPTKQQLSGRARSFSGPVNSARRRDEMSERASRESDQRARLRTIESSQETLLIIRVSIYIRPEVNNSQLSSSRVIYEIGKAPITRFLRTILHIGHHFCAVTSQSVARSNTLDE